MTIHDLRDLQPEHNYTIEQNGDQIVAYGWACGIEKDDTLILRGTITEPEKELHYLVKEISYLGSPPDMWRAHLMQVLTVELSS